MSAFATWFDMGGYALYVWTSFGLSALALGGVVAWSAAEHRRVRRTVFARAIRREVAKSGETS